MRTRFARSGKVVALALAGAASCSVGAPSPTTHVIEIRDLRFVPDTVQAAPGDSLVWINRDPVPHTATDREGRWDSGELAPGGTWARVVEAGDAGGYLCRYHPVMVGLVGVAHRASASDIPDPADLSPFREPPMPVTPRYSPGERRGLWIFAAVGLLGINTAFLIGLATPGAMRQALGNPIAVAFMAEAFLLIALLGWLFAKWGVARLGWPWLLGLSLLGGLAFAIPVVLLWGRWDDRTAADTP